MYTKEAHLMAKPHCQECRFRAKYDKNPTSILGRLWHWHVSWCPGWKAYMQSLSAEKRAEIATRYSLRDNIQA
jgi:hypothetical protein